MFIFIIIFLFFSAKKSFLGEEFSLNYDLTQYVQYWAMRLSFPAAKYMFQDNNTRLMCCTLPWSVQIQQQRGVILLPNFQKEDAWHILNFQRGLLERGGNLFQGESCKK